MSPNTCHPCLRSAHIEGVRDVEVAIRPERQITPVMATVLGERKLARSSATFTPGRHGSAVSVEDPDAILERVDDVEGAVGSDGDAPGRTFAFGSQRDLPDELCQGRSRWGSYGSRRRGIRAPELRGHGDHADRCLGGVLHGAIGVLLPEESARTLSERQLPGVLGRCQRLVRF
jgi:hypothetical protein